MEKSISALCGSLSSVLDHASTSSRALADAVSSRPIYLESATSAFLQKLDRLTEATGADLGNLESMTFGAVSFQELLGHFAEELNVYARHADAIETRLASFGYVPPEVEPEVDVQEEEQDGAPGNSCLGGSSSVLRSSRGRFDTLFEESMSLENLGLSDACLATLSSKATDFAGSPLKLDKIAESPDDLQKTMKEPEHVPPQEETNGQGNAFQAMIRATKEEYEQLPSYMRTLASWEELQEAVSKLNSYFCGDKTPGSVSLNQDDVGAVGLGRKGRSYLLILMRMNQLTMETVDGSIFYTLCKNDS